MPDELFEFQWQVHENGYEWVKAPWQESFLSGKLMDPDLFLTSGVPDGVVSRGWRYYPLRQHTGLFRHFAATEISRESVQQFANTYGLLGGDISRLILLPGKGAIHVSFHDKKGRKRKDNLTHGTGETPQSWAVEISEMRQTLEFWDLVKKEDRKQLARHVHWVKPDSVHIKFQQGGSWIATPEIRSYRLQHMSKGDVIRPALFHIQETINRRLEGRVSPRLLWNPKRGEMAMHIVPNCLVGALWLQFARAVDGNKDYDRCLECKTWFEVSLDAARTNRRYCKDACRFKAYRRRQSEARRLSEKGISVKEIAKRLDSDSVTVRSWIDRLSKR